MNKLILSSLFIYFVVILETQDDGKANASKIMRNRREFEYFIFEGNETNAEKYPWMAPYRIYYKNNERVSICGGSLISSTKILTAAHCMEDEIIRLEVILGASNLSDISENVIVLNATKHMSHPNYSSVEGGSNGRTFYIKCDIGVITIPEVKFTATIQPIRLSDSSSTYVGQTGIAVGFGSTTQELGHTNDIMMEVNLTIIDNAECNSRWASKSVTIFDSQICTHSSNGAGFCQGDSGGPLIVESASGENIVIGVISITDTYCKDYPHVYTSVFYNLDWIKMNMKEGEPPEGIGNQDGDVTSQKGSEPIEGYGYFRIIKMLNVKENTLNDKENKSNVEENTTMNKYPWMTVYRIHYNETDRKSGMCGGTLISSTKVLTAAHCLQHEIVVLEVTLGAHDLNKLPDGVIVENTTDFVKNSFFQVNDRSFPTYMMNDIAMITISKVDFSNNIRPVRLPTDGSSYTDKWGIATGFGYTSPEDANLEHRSTQMKEISLQVISLASCRSIWSVRNTKIFDSQVCAENSDKSKIGICYGDSGGPFTVMDEAGESILIGISSIVSPVGCKGAPSVFSKVSSYLNWIEMQMEKRK